jgi:release factor glutamine methyltransferase
MTIEQFVQQNTRKLESYGIGTARLDILVLLEDCLNKNRAHILAHPNLNLTIEQQKWLNTRIDRRIKHEPLAYIRGKTEFYGREFIINKYVLEPRPESETMIDLLLSSQYSNENLNLIDIGTGCGALGITSKLELNNLNVDLLDIDRRALDVASQNSSKYCIDSQIIKSNLFTNTNQPYDIILANLPYVPDEFHINEAANAEPKIAIFGGKDGLDVYRNFFAQLQNLIWRPKLILTESLPPQHDKLAKIASLSGFRLTLTDDFIQQFEN